MRLLTRDPEASMKCGRSDEVSGRSGEGPWRSLIGVARDLVRQRHGGALVFLTLYVAMALVTRLVLIARTAEAVAWDWTLPVGLLVGVGYDLVAGGIAVLPLTIYLVLVPERVWASRIHQAVMVVAGFAVVYGLVILAAAEQVFWTEFNARFNFIAVDYLVYTEEVLGNIRESYPTHLIFAALAAVAVAIWLVVARLEAARSWLWSTTPAGKRLRTAAVLVVLPIAALTVLEESDIPDFANNFNRELVKDGVFSLFAAFQANHLEYESFYTTQSRSTVFRRLRRLLSVPVDAGKGDPPESLVRHVAGRNGVEQHYNVVQITVESLSASFMAHFGDTSGLTPNLDRLASEGLLFTEFYATGTRTTRGMEALSLSLPPTPGRSIVHRENNQGLFTLGSVMRTRGYDTVFLYGGYGYFDSMNRYFEGNGYRVIDRSAMPAEEVSFATIWGACDEDLFRWTMAEADRDFAAGTPFHFFVMTTSNHRPYTYPEGRIDIPSMTGRAGAVKYTDYAIGQFVDEARTRPWFDNTIFVIVADHCASSAGKAEITVPKYRIPMIFYSPGTIEPGEVTVLGSQVDFAPTLLSVLGWSYNSIFFGRDLLAADQGPEHAFVGNYQTLGLLTRDRLVTLRPKREDHTWQVDRRSGTVAPLAMDRELADDAVAYYQGAGILFTEGRYAERLVVN